MRYYNFEIVIEKETEDDGSRMTRMPQVTSRELISSSPRSGSGLHLSS